MMIKKKYRLQLASPAFLGDADQRGVWRTPPLKALIREWWRVAVAPELGYDTHALKARETTLFGTAADDSREGNQQSRVRLALGHWSEGTMRDYVPLGNVDHPETERTRYKVEPLNYLGYGPIDRGRLKFGAALQADETNQLRLALPDDEQAQLTLALNLANWFGTVGGRSRNGWGSLLLMDEDSNTALAPLCRDALEETACTRSLEQCLRLDWPHAIGADSKAPLVWKSASTFSSWRDAMKFLAQTKIGFRVDLGFVGGQPHREPQARHLLAYPITNHKVPAWEGKDKGRLANTLRFKLHKEADGSVRTLIYHTPCKPTLPHHGVDLLSTWQRVHRHLDANAQLIRLA